MINIQCNWCGFTFLGDGDEIACPVCGRSLNLNFKENLEEDSSEDE